MAGAPIAIFEVPQRVETILAALDADPRFAFVEPTGHGVGPVEAVHDPGLIEHLASAWKRATAEGVQAAGNGGAEVVPDTFLHPAIREGMGPAPVPSEIIAAMGSWVFDTATPLVEGTYVAARAAVDIALTALHLVLAGEPTTYALCRPPGHHAVRAAYGGYCYFNNAAIAAQAAIDAGASRAVVLDVDYHHGNGTQQIFYDRGEVMYTSLHADPNRAYPYYVGYADETGTGSGRNTTLNRPLPADTDDESYLAALDGALEAIDAFDPEVVVVSLGVDTYRLDPIGDFQVTTEGLAEQGRRIGSLARPTVVVQEGGYHLADLGRNVHAFLDGVRDTRQVTGRR